MAVKISTAELRQRFGVRKGNVCAIQRKDGISILYRWRLGGKKYSKTFPVGTDDKYIEAFISETSAKILKEKLGLADFSGEDIPEIKPEQPKRITVYELLDWYVRSAVQESLEDKKEEARTYSLVTIENNEKAFRRFIKFLKSEDVPIDTIEKRHLYEFRRYLAEQGWVDRSIKQYIAIVKSILKKAVDEGKLREYPFWGFKLKRMTRARPRDLLTFDEMKQVIRMISDKNVKLAAIISMYGGFRLADILRMKKENINHEKKTISFWMSKRREWIEMPLRDELAKILSRFKGQTGPIIEVETKRGRKRAYVSYIPKIYSRAIKKLKGAHYWSGPHTFRHSFSHILEINEVPWQVQQFLLGHKIKEMTGRYSHPEKRLRYFRSMLAKIDFKKKDTEDDFEEATNGQM